MDNNIENISNSQDIELCSKAKTSLILGIIGMIAWILPIVGLPVQIVGLLKGIKGMKSTKSNLATAGVVLCIVGLVFTIVNASIGAYMGATGQHPLVNKIYENIEK